MTDRADESVFPQESKAFEGVPSRVSRYRLLEKIGGGGMGVVYKARHIALNRIVALKLLHVHRANDEDFAARFWREMEAAGKLDHPHVVRATDAGLEDDVLFLAMDLLTGTDLEKLIQANGRLGVADACELVRQAALGLGAIRQAHMVHRDIKPSNLFLTSDGVLKVLDLGLATTRDGSQTELTKSNVAMGTCDYMAPEQANGSRDVDIRADIYSLGCTMYKLLTGRVPFSGAQFGNQYLKMKAHAEEPFPPLGVSGVPERVEAILRAMTEKDPERRLSNPLTLAQDLKPWSANGDALRGLGAISAATTGNRHSDTKPMVDGSPTGPSIPGRWRWVVGVLAAIAVAICISVGIRNIAKKSPPQDLLAAPNPKPAAAPPGPIVGVPFDLLAASPVELWAPRNAALGRQMTYSAENRMMRIDSSGLCLYQLGSTDSKNYKIHVRFNRNGGENVFGAFVGYQIRRDANRDVARYLYCYQYVVANDRLLRVHERHMDQATGNYTKIPLELGERKTNAAGIAKQLLTLEVIEGKLARVSLDEAEIVLPPPLHPAAELSGNAFGVANSSGSVTIESAQLTLGSPEKP